MLKLLRREKTMHSTSNIVSLNRSGNSEALDRGSPDGSEDDQRGELRKFSGERLFVQITQSNDQDLLGITLSCTTTDASSHGIKFVSDQFIPVGCLLDLWVDDNTRPGKFFLSGDVRWTQKVGHAKTIVGVRLQEGLATDIDTWREIHL
jgi:hypothetical protein